ncbi:MAG TPA: hypothetical protein VKD25_11265, partial [Burkholderiales bacterium]|nr:hypothetical protein [Burkholderiales bacterium]
SVGTQIRSAANQNNVAHYLEGGNETGIATSTFVNAAATPTFNDRLLPLSGADVMTPVEIRAVREILNLLWAYRSTSACACYPWVDRDDNGTDGRSNNNNYSGRVPLVSASPHDWSDLGITTGSYPALAWLRTNRWWWVFLYTIADTDSENHGSETLTVNGVPGTKVVIVTTGPAGAGRPVTNWIDSSYWSSYIEDWDNRDGGTSFYTPWSTDYARDRLYTLF